MKNYIFNYIAIIILLMLLAGCSSFHSHKWSEANYQSPSTCSICQETRGTPLEADFDAHEITINLSQDSSLDYHTICNLEDCETCGKVTVSEKKIIDSDAEHPAKTGYQWQIVTLKAVFDDEASNLYGFNYNYLTANYYDIEGFEQSYNYVADATHSFTVNFNGTDYTECQCYVDAHSSEWTKYEDRYQKTVTVTWNFLVPTGYDGMVVGFRNSAVDTEGKYFLYQYYDAESFLLFRVMP